MIITSCCTGWQLSLAHMINLAATKSAKAVYSVHRVCIQCVVMDPAIGQSKKRILLKRQFHKAQVLTNQGCSVDFSAFRNWFDNLIFKELCFISNLHLP